MSYMISIINYNDSVMSNLLNSITLKTTRSIFFAFKHVNKKRQ